MKRWWFESMSILRSIFDTLKKVKYPQIAIELVRVETEFILTIWKKELLADNWTDFVSAFDTISIKAVDGDSLYKKKEVPGLVQQVRSLGKTVHLWGFHFCTSEETSRAEARVAARACNMHKAVAYHWNAEKHWDNSVSPELNGMAFADEFKKCAPDVELIANCFNGAATGELLERFDVFEPMCYGTKAATIASKIRNRMRREDVPGCKRGIMVGTGRKHGEHQAWGFYETNSAAVPGLKDLVVETCPVVVNFFRAGVADGEDIMVEGNDLNPALNEQVLGIKEALGYIPRSV